MAELCLKIKRDNRPDPFFQDGDIMTALNDRRIKDVHTQHICHPKKMGFTSSGLRATGCLLDFHLSKVMQYKFQRISNKEIKRITLATLDEEILSDKPNAKKEAIDVPLFITRRLKSDRHQIFGTPGNEYWYGGHTDASLVKLADIWKEIEAKTIYKEVNFTRWPFTEGELKNYLCIAVDDFDNTTRGELEESVYDEKDIENPIMTKKRKHKVDWENLPGVSLGSKTDISAKDVKVDIREIVTFIRNQIVEVKIG